ncbi:MAG: GNAT family N-acetyltransferase [Planctomycetota bacterium]|jgi:GNAT superfamily N-acetyltransferase
MNRSFLLNRFVRYYRLNGATGTIWKALDKIKELLFRKPEILFFVDLVTRDGNGYVLPDNFTIQCLRSADEIPSQDLDTLFERLGEKIIRYDITERFGKGALLWLVKVDGTLAGYIWSINGGTVRPHYFSLTDKDVHLFDNYVLKEFRGQGINPKLINYVLDELQREGLIRVYIETNIANTSEIRSLAKTDFKEFGVARKSYAGARSFVIWSKK